MCPQQRVGRLRSTAMQLMSVAAPLPCRLHAQLGWRALGKRLLILHGSKAVALLAFAAAMQHPGAVGWLLTAGVVLLAPALGAPRPGATRRQPLLRGGLLAAAIAATLWMLAQYALLLPWLQVSSSRQRSAFAGLLKQTPFPPQSGIAGHSPPSSILIYSCCRTCCCACRPTLWTWRSGWGCCCCRRRRALAPSLAPPPSWSASSEQSACCSSPQPCACGPSGKHTCLSGEMMACRRCQALLPHVLRCPCFSRRWQAKLPDEVAAAGRCGAPCPLFWPQSPDYVPPLLGERRFGSKLGVKWDVKGCVRLRQAPTSAARLPVDCLQTER